MISVAAWSVFAAMYDGPESDSALGWVCCVALLPLMFGVLILTAAYLHRRYDQRQSGNRP
jgi:hypothetical protein